MKKNAPHLESAHKFWQEFLSSGDIVIDATCGNGFDSLNLAKLILNKQLGKLICFDIQNEAIEATKKLLEKNLSLSELANTQFFHESHEDFSKYIDVKPNLFVYNLGYLPKSDKKIITQSSTTLKSILSALEMLAPKGAISITCYRGHEGGLEEEQAILDFVKQLDYKIFNVCYLQWINKELSPSLIWISKLI